jgi:RHS repeat-associated protein
LPGNRVTGEGSWSYQYNVAGQVVSKASGATTWNYTYDHRGQMTQATDGTTTVNYSFDAFGNRLSTNDGTSDERYVLDGWDSNKPGAIGNENFDVVADIKDGGDLLNARMFGDGFDSLAVRVDKDGNEGWYLADRQGNIRLMHDDAGVTATRDYTAYGDISNTTGTPDRYGYTGREYDAVTGLTHYRARERAGGAWYSPDPIGFAGGDANLLRYVGNDTVNMNDPSGLQSPSHGSNAGNSPVGFNGDPSNRYHKYGRSGTSGGSTAGTGSNTGDGYSYATPRFDNDVSRRYGAVAHPPAPNREPVGKVFEEVLPNGDQLEINRVNGRYIAKLTARVPIRKNYIALIEKAKKSIEALRDDIAMTRRGMALCYKPDFQEVESRRNYRGSRSGLRHEWRSFENHRGVPIATGREYGAMVVGSGLDPVLGDGDSI